MLKIECKDASLPGVPGLSGQSDASAIVSTLLGDVVGVECSADAVLGLVSTKWVGSAALSLSAPS
jgi:hypothetical protein